MQQTSIPKGVIFSQFLLTVPLICYTGNLCLLAPMLDSGLVDPARFAYVARTCVRLLALNVSFTGGIHYGLGSAMYETEESEDKLGGPRLQMVYSVVPACMSVAAAGTLLYTTPLTPAAVIFGFTSFMLTQLVTHQIDLKMVEKGQAPAWFLKFRSFNFGVYMLITSTLFLIWFKRIKDVHHSRDPHRVQKIKDAMELEDTEFIKAVEGQRLDYNINDLTQVDKDIVSKFPRLPVQPQA